MLTLNLFVLADVVVVVVVVVVMNVTFFDNYNFETVVVVIDGSLPFMLSLMVVVVHL